MAQISESNSLQVHISTITTGLAEPGQGQDLQVVAPARGVGADGRGSVRRFVAESGVREPAEWDGVTPRPTGVYDSAFHVESGAQPYALAIVTSKYRDRDYQRIVRSVALRLARETRALMRKLRLVHSASVTTATMAATSMSPGLTVAATNHPTRTGTRSNRGSSAWDYAAFEAARVAISEWVTYEDTEDGWQWDGFIVECSPTLYPRVKEVQLRQLGGSTGNAQQDTVGGHFGIVGVIENPYMTATQWTLHPVVRPPVDPEQDVDMWGGQPAIDYMPDASPADAVGLSAVDTDLYIDRDTGAIVQAIDWRQTALWGPTPDRIYASPG
jgi:hypothetical protein